VNKIFQIGFNRCATTSLYHLFLDLGYSAIHNDHGGVARQIEDSLRKNGVVDLGTYESYQVLTDMEFVSPWRVAYGFKRFEEIENAYPNCKFIYNTRPLEDWINSRWYLNNGRYREKWRKYLCNVDDQAIADYWRWEWIAHDRKVREYFRNKNNMFEYVMGETRIDSMLRFLEVDAECIPSLERKNVMRAAWKSK
jgi:hypothetical protein